MLAFAARALITALSFELFEDSYEQGGLWRAAIGLLVGAVVFTLLSAWLDRAARGGHPKQDGSEKLDPNTAAAGRAPSAASTSGAAGLALLAAVALDGVPENIALGVSLGSGTGGLALLAAIFVSNFPEALVGSASMRAQGRSQRFILGTWIGCAVLLTLAVVLGAGPLVQRLGREDLTAAGLRRGCSPGITCRHLDAGGLREGRTARRPEYHRRVRPVLRPGHPLTSSRRRPSRRFANLSLQRKLRSMILAGDKQGGGGQPMNGVRPHQPPDPDRSTDPPLYRIAVSHSADTSTVILTGELDLACRTELENTLIDGVADAHHRSLILDMAAVSFLDSTAISALVAAYHHARQAGARITIVRPSRQVAKVLQMTGLLDLFTDDDVPSGHPPDGPGSTNP